MKRDKHTVRLSPKTWNIVETHFQQDNCGTRNEFIEKAILFYAGYLKCNDSSAYLPRVVSDLLNGILEQSKKKLGRLLFKLCVEQNICNHILAAESDIDIPLYDKLRGRGVREVKETNGEISFIDDLKFQKELD